MSITHPKQNTHGVAPKRRLAYLRSYLRAGRYVPETDLIARKVTWVEFRDRVLGLAIFHGCYVCSERAEEWHHIVRIIMGGQDRRNNVVPLCLSCHKKVHRKDEVRPNKKKEQWVSPLGKPQVAVVFVPKNSLEKPLPLVISNLGVSSPARTPAKGT